MDFRNQEARRQTKGNDNLNIVVAMKRSEQDRMCF